MFALVKLSLALIVLSSVFSNIREIGVDIGVAGGVIAALVITHQKIVKPVLKAATAVVELVKLAESIEKRVSNLESASDSFTKIIDLARDEHVDDVRTLIRRGEIPHPIITDPARPPQSARRA